MSNLRLATMRSHGEALKFLDKRDTKRVGHNTVARKIAHAVDTDDEYEYDVAVRYHSTDIVTYHPDGSITLDTGGWDTTTTTNRMNMLTPAHIRVNRHQYQTIVTDVLTGTVWRGITRLTVT